MGKKINSVKKAPLTRKGFSVFAGLSVSLLTFSSVEALNIGQARTQSYLGQPLSVFIPVSDSGRVVDLNQLIVAQPSVAQLKDLNVSQTISDVSYQVVNKGTEKGILITTQTAFNEPYLDLGVKVDYQGASQLSKFTVLIDLEPPVTGASSNQGEEVSLAANSSAYGSPLISNSTSIKKTPLAQNKRQTSQITTADSSVITYTREIMGPYDWAQKTLIPEKFGPVLQGQSLWRVARRINQAMDVSIDQMMWALYRNNPQAFSGQNVSTLQAGSILSIPKESFVREVTELGAVRLLNPQETTNQTSVQSSALTESSSKVASSEVSTEIAVGSQLTAIVNADKDKTVSSSNDIQLGSDIESVNEESALEPINTTSNNAVKENQADSVVSLSKLDIVDDLKNEITYLNQQVEDQGRRIQALEQRLAIAESKASIQAVDSQSVVSIDNTNPILDSANSVSSENNNVVNPINVATPVVEPSSKIISPTSVKVWSLAALALFLLGFAYYARHKVMPILLKVFGDKFEYDEDESFLSSVSKKRKPLRPLNANDEASGDSDTATSASNQDGHDDFEDYSFFIDHEEIMDVEELSFPDRIKQLVDSGDFDEAKKTVSFASEANINEHDTNVYLLKIYAAESDRENFDILFHEIHKNIDEYDDEAQLMIAEIQSEMAIGKVINFNNEKKVG